MFGHPPVFVIGFCAALIGAGVIGWKMAPINEPAAKAFPVAAPPKAMAMPLCGNGKRVNCIVDGDTIWVNGEKIRLQGFNAPEMNGSCEQERRLAVKARDELRRAINGRSLAIERNGQDRYGRTLATVRVDGRDVADELIDRGLAHRWRGYKESWC